MPDENPRSIEKLSVTEEFNDLLDCRMAMLGLDAVASDAGDRLEEIRRRCASCGYREACAVDLKRDPNNPVWETYCPNSDALMALTKAYWQTV